jgi:hypothetical protein
MEYFLLFLFTNYQLPLVCYTVLMEPKKRALVITAVVVVIVALSVVFYLIDKAPTPEERTQNELLEKVRQAEAPQKIPTNTLTGTVKGVYGATIDIELTGGSGDPLRFASVLADTKYYLVNTGKLDALGNPTVTSITLASIAAGDSITVTGEGDIGTMKKFDVTEVRKVR